MIIEIILGGIALAALYFAEQRYHFGRKWFRKSAKKYETA